MTCKDPEARKAYMKAYGEARRAAKRVLKQCETCSTVIVGRRADARFCSRACLKNDPHNRAVDATYRASHKGRLRAWKGDNRERVRSYNAHRHALKLRACPPWADRKALEAIYEGCPADHDIDHIRPLKGRHWSGKWEPGDSLLWLLKLPDDAEDIDGKPISTRVSLGLHVPLNLMPLSDEENLSKSNQAPQPGYMDWFGHSLVNGLHV
jgi:hypothetical protein